SYASLDWLENNSYTDNLDLEENSYANNNEIVSDTNNLSLLVKNSTFREVANDDFKNIEEGSNTTQFYYILEQNFKNAISLENIAVANQPFPNPDTDGDGVNDDIDEDDDNDGILDTLELQCSSVPNSNNSFANSGTYSLTGDNGGLTIDITRLDNSFNMEINGTKLVTTELQFDPSAYNVNTGHSLARFVSDDSAYGENGIGSVWGVSGGSPNSVFLRVVINSSGEVSLYGSRTSTGPLELMYIQNGDPQFNNITLNESSNNTVVITQVSTGQTYISGGYYFSELTCVDIDVDGDGISNRLDLDSDGDGIPDNIEAQSTAAFTVPASDNAATYTTNNGLNSSYITSNGITPIDTDGDGLPDFIDLDSDNAQTDDTTEAGLTVSNNDTDNDGLDDNNDSNNSVYGPANAGITDLISTYPNNGQDTNFRAACENGTTDAGLCILYEGRVFEDSGTGAGGIFGDCIENGDENSLNLPYGLYANVVQGSTLVYSSLLDSSGNYQIPHLEDGNYEIVITTDPLSTSVSLPNLYSFGANGWYFISVVNDVVTSPSSIPTICIQSCEFGKIASGDQYVIAATGATNWGSPNHLIGEPNGTVAGIYQNNQSGTNYRQVLDFGEILPTNTNITFYVQWINGYSKDFTVEYSTDNTSFTSHPSSITINSTSIIAETITSTENFRYIRLNGASSNSHLKFDAVKVSYEICNDCPTGVNAPALSTTTITNDCDDSVNPQTMNLTSITATNQPANTTLTWHTGVPATDANKVSAPATAVAGIYYASFYSFTSQCYTLEGEAVTVVTADGDSDCDGVNDSIDIDDDNDGVLDTEEGICNLSGESDLLLDDVTLSGSGNVYALSSVTNYVAQQTPAGSEEPSGQTYINGYDSAGGGSAITATFNNPTTFNIANNELTIKFQYYNNIANTTSESINSLYTKIVIKTDAGDFDLQHTLTAAERTSIQNGNWIPVEFTIAIEQSTVTINSMDLYLESIIGGDTTSFNPASNEVFALAIDGIQTGNSCTDTDGDGIPNSLDLDSDGDGCIDTIEAGTSNDGTTTDANNNGLLDQYENGTTGTINYTSTYSVYAINNAIYACTDTDSDGVNDVFDIDDDNDGVLDTASVGGDVIDN
ncbi:hypothetical protein N9X55_05995, partial [Flavobacteriaceae bacterium]|nr:hypothetical protein [Flavobacteriaceae bacterium]